MKKNRESLRQGLALAIQDAAKVGLIRLSRIEVNLELGKVKIN